MAQYFNSPSPVRKWWNVGHDHTGASDSHFTYCSVQWGECVLGTCFALKWVTNLPHIIMLSAPLHVESFSLMSLYLLGFALAKCLEHSKVMFENTTKDKSRRR